jgi:hypothetical protein
MKGDWRADEVLLELITGPILSFPGFCPAVSGRF